MTEDNIQAEAQQMAKQLAGKERDMRKYLKKGMFPTIFCNGCGHGTVLGYTFWAIEELGIPIDNYVFVSGIGCSSRMPGYIQSDGLHTTHGRALAFATGVKAANPDLNVVVFTGDGDCTGIGGNHFIHAARRNIDITVVLLNNYIYGMTGGQLAPTTPHGYTATTAPYGNIEHPFDVAELVKAAGATYIARWTTNHPYQPIKAIKEGIENKGFSYIEIFSPCPTAFGRRNKMGEVKALWRWYKDRSILVEEYDRIMKYGTEAEKSQLEDKIQIGVLHKKEKPEFTTEWKKLVQRVMK